MRTPNTKHGSTIVLVTVVIATLVVCVAGALDYSQQIARVVQRTTSYQTATEIADGCLELEFSAWREVCRESYNTPVTGAAVAQNLPLVTSTMFSGLSGFGATTNSAPSPAPMISNYRVQAVDPQLNPVLNGTGTPVGAGGLTASSTSAASTSYYYLASANVTLPSLTGKPVAVNLRRVFQKQIESPWQFAIFYQDDLEIHPGAAMTIAGWVHTNGNLYTGAGVPGQNNLTFGSKVTYSDDYASTGYSTADSSHAGDAVAPPAVPSNLPPAEEQMQQVFGLDASRIFSVGASNPNDDSYHEIIEPPVAGYPDPLAANRYYDMAGVLISVDASGNKTISVPTAGGFSQVTSGPVFTTFNSAVTVGATIQDEREGAQVRLVDVNVATITSAVNAGTISIPGKIVYVYDASVSGTTQRGVRLKNGATLPDGGLTFASQNPVYIQGDYNTGATSSTMPLSDASTPDTTQPTVAGYVRKPSSVLADAVTILSNNWNDSNDTNSSSSLGSRNATNTTVNTAIIAGIVSSAGGNYSGGAENFPRFLENWSGSTFTYYGSMVELYQSQQATGPWGSGNVYNPPNRAWYFDTTFLTNPPPGPLVINYVKGMWYTE